MVFLSQTIVEKRLIEDEERKTREITQLYRKELPRWDVQIRTHPKDDDESWERGNLRRICIPFISFFFASFYMPSFFPGSETTEVSSIGWSAVEESPIHPTYTGISQDTYIRREQTSRQDSDRTTVTRAMQKLQQDDTQVWNEKWKVLFRVLESPQPGPSTSRGPYHPPSHHHHHHHSSEHHITTAYHDVDYDSETASILTEDDREKWRQIITTENTLRQLLTEATYREDYERISRDTRFEKLFEPEKWDVIIRTISYPEHHHHHHHHHEPGSSHTMGSSSREMDDRLFSDSTSEISSSEVSSSAPIKPNRMFRKKSSDTTGTDGKSITDVRSMTEMMVDFTDTFDPRDDTSSVVSSVPGGMVRSIADRSSTEIVEFAPLEETDTDSSLGVMDQPGYSQMERVTQQITQQERVVQSGSGGTMTQQQQQQTSSSSTNVFSSKTSSSNVARRYI